MTDGKPEFHEDYASPEAEIPGFVEFDYDAVDGIEKTNEWDALCADLIRMIAGMIEGDASEPGYTDQVFLRAWDFGQRSGAYLGGIDRHWLLQFMDKDPFNGIDAGRKYQHLKKLEKAANFIFKFIYGDRLAPNWSEQVSTKTICLAWILSPALFDGRSQKDLAKAVGMHTNTLSLYTADISRRLGIRNHAQSKGWNFDKDKALSNAVDVRQYQHVSFVVKDAWTTGSMAFKAAETATAATFWPVYSKDNAMPRVPAQAGTLHGTDDLIGQQHFIKFWSEDGSAGTVAQAGTRTIKYWLKG